MANRNVLICLTLLSLCTHGTEPPRKKLRYTAMTEDEILVNQVRAAADNPWQLCAIVRSNPLACKARLQAFSPIPAIVASSYPQHLPIILQAGVPVDQKDIFDRTSLTMATRRDDWGATEALLEHKAQVDLLDNKNRDALMYALSGDLVSATALQLLWNESMKPHINRTVCYPDSSKKTTYLRAILKRTGWRGQEIRKEIVTRLLALGAHVGSDELLAGLAYQQDISQLLPKASVDDALWAAQQAIGRNIPGALSYVRSYGTTTMHDALSPFLLDELIGIVRGYVAL